jgi:hypothetical protein
MKKQKNGEVVAVEVWAPEAPAAGAIAPDEITAQYRRAVAGCLEMVRFGAMMVEVSFNLTREIGRRGGGHTPPEETLKGWLAEHCPDVNYATAMRFKLLAEGVQRACQIPAGTPLRLMLPGPAGETDAPIEWAREGSGRRLSDDRIRALRQQVWELVDGQSARQLLFQFMANPADHPKGGARPPSTAKNDPDFRHQAVADFFALHIQALLDAVRKHSDHLVLTSAELRTFADDLSVVRDTLREAMGKGK